MSVKNKVFQIVSIFLGFLFLVLALAYVWVKRPVAVQAQCVKIAVVDGLKIKNLSKPFVRVRELLEEQHAKAHKEILAQENAIRKEHEDLKSGLASVEEKKKRKNDVDKKIAELEKNVQKKKDTLTKQFSILMDMVESEMNGAIAHIVKKHGFNLVLNKSIQETRVILFHEPALDITDQVINRLDETIKTVELPLIS
jgi:Skp family chaperone for outer membrane proteins